MRSAMTEAAVARAAVMTTMLLHVEINLNDLFKPPRCGTVQARAVLSPRARLDDARDVRPERGQRGDVEDVGSPARISPATARGERPPPLFRAGPRARPRGGPRPRAWALASRGNRARPRCRRRPGALGVRVAALALPAARATAGVQARHAHHVPRDRGRVPGARRAAAAVRLL